MASRWEFDRRLASELPLGYGAIKEIVGDAEDSKFQDAMNLFTRRHLRTVDELYASEDQAEGVFRFPEKGDPVWKVRLVAPGQLEEHASGIGRRWLAALENWPVANQERVVGRFPHSAHTVR